MGSRSSKNRVAPQEITPPLRCVALSVPPQHLPSWVLPVGHAAMACALIGRRVELPMGMRETFGPSLCLCEGCLDPCYSCNLVGARPDNQTEVSTLTAYTGAAQEAQEASLNILTSGDKK